MAKIRNSQLHSISKTPSPNSIVMSKEDGKIDDSWVNSKTTSTANSIVMSKEDGQIDHTWLNESKQFYSGATLKATMEYNAIDNSIDFIFNS